MFFYQTPKNWFPTDWKWILSAYGSEKPTIQQLPLSGSCWIPAPGWFFTEESFAFRFPLTPASNNQSISSKMDLLAQAGRGRAHPGTTCRLRSESRRRGTFENRRSESAQVLVLALLVDLNQGNRKPKRTFSFRSEKERKYAPFRHKRVLSILTPQNRPFP